MCWCLKWTATAGDETTTILLVKGGGGGIVHKGQWRQNRKHNPVRNGRNEPRDTPSIPALGNVYRRRRRYRAHAPSFRRSRVNY